MTGYRLRALVVRKTKLGETDLILTLLADDGRQVRAVAKGARKPGSRLSARLEPGCVADLLLHPGRNLEVVSEAESVAAHAGLRDDYDRSCAASIVLDLADKVSVEAQAEDVLFPLCVTALDVLASAETADVRLVTVAFLIKAMAMQGYRPQLDSCVQCASDSVAGGFSLAAGGVLCAECGELDAASFPLSQEGRHLVGALMQARLAEVPSLAPEPEVAAEVTRLVRAFVAHHVPARLKSLEFLG
ncbi:MAG: DNA repair protein RecO [Coriobacteriaceae bacterium]|nr:DNA repair protein RecO [Coriobacteriaceae bacterium]